MTDRDILDQVTLLLREAREAENGTARALGLSMAQAENRIANVHSEKGSGQ